MSHADHPRADLDVPPGARAWAEAQAPVCMLDFQPQTYTALNDHLRVRRVGTLWYGEVQSHLSPVWYVVTEHHQTAQGCMLATLTALGMSHQVAEHDCTKDHAEEPF